MDVGGMMPLPSVISLRRLVALLVCYTSVDWTLQGMMPCPMQVQVKEKWS